MKIRVLYLHHCGSFGGSSKSLLELIEAFPSKSVEAFIITQKGSSADFFKANHETITTIGLSIFDHSRLGYYRGLRWLIMLREIFYIPFTVYSLIKAKIRWKHVDVIHANEYYLVIPVIIAKILFGSPVIVHSRSLQENRYGKIRNKFFKWFINNFVDSVIAIDQDVLSTQMDPEKAIIVHNGIRPPSAQERLLPPDEWPKEEGKIVIGFVGLFQPYKGMGELIEAARLCQMKGLNIVFTFVGYSTETKGLRKVVSIIRNFFRKHSKTVDYEQIVWSSKLENIYFIPFQKDVSRVYSNLDILCFPSHLEAVGRPVFEAAFYNKPSIVAITRPNRDTIIDGVTGICVKPGNAEELAAAIENLSNSPEVIHKMGKNAFELATQNFDIFVNAKKVLSIYHELVKQSIK